MASFELTTKSIFSASTAQVTRQDVDEMLLTVVASGLSNFENIYVWVSLDGGGGSSETPAITGYYQKDQVSLS